MYACKTPINLHATPPHCIQVLCLPLCLRACLPACLPASQAGCLALALSLRWHVPCQTRRCCQSFSDAICGAAQTRTMPWGLMGLVKLGLRELPGLGFKKGFKKP